MAALNAAQKVQIYRILYRMNLSFVRIVGSCGELKGAGVFRTKFTGCTRHSRRAAGGNK